MWVSDLKSIGYEDIKTVQSFEAQQEPCIGQDALKGVYFHPSVRIKEYEHRSRQGKILVEDFEHQLKKSESFASRMLKRLCPSVDLKTALANYNQYDPHDNILLIVTLQEQANGAKDEDLAAAVEEWREKCDRLHLESEKM